MPHTMPHTPKHKFYVQLGRDEEIVEGRQAAVRRARSASSKSRVDVLVERADGQVRMTFRGGSLETMISDAGRRGRDR